MAQFARPNSDIGSLNWATFSNEFAKIDEVSPSDADITESISGSQAGYLEVGLSAIADPQVATGHVIHVRLSRTGAITLTAPIELRNAGGILASFAPSVSSGTPATFTYTLSAGEANSIPTGDYAGGLRLRINKSESDDAAGQLQDSWAQFEAPDAGFTHLDISAGGHVNAAASSGNYEVLDGGGYRRVAGVEGSGAMILNGSQQIVVQA